MNKINSGFNDAVGELLGGFVLGALIPTILLATNTSPIFGFVLGLLGALGSIALSLSLAKMGFSYLFGWVVGILILLSSNMVGLLEFLLFFIIPLVVLIIRLLVWVKS